MLDSNEEITIKFNDNNMYNRIRNILGNKIKSASNKEIVITRANLNTVTSLDLTAGEDNKIADITGIENFTNLIELKLKSNNIKDISLLENLTKLKILDVSENQLNNIDVLSKLVNLQELDISNTTSSDIKKLATLRNLEKLTANRNSISNLSPISSLYNLKYLRLSNNNIDNDNLNKLGYLGLITLDLSNNSAITDIEIIPKIETLQNLYLANNNSIYNIYMVCETKIIIVKEPRQEIVVDEETGEEKEETVYEDVEKEVIRLANLKTLDLENTMQESQVSMSQLAMLENLETLNLNNNGIESLTDITNLENLKNLYLNNNELTDESLYDLAFYEEVYDEEREMNIWVLRKVNVNDLRLSGNKIKSISRLSYLTSTINYLDLSSNYISNIAVLESMYQIKNASNGRPAASRINLQNQRIVIPVKQRSFSDQKIILPNIAQKCKDSESIIYYPDLRVEFDVENTYLNTDNYTYNEVTGNYNTPGLYNVVLSKNLVEGDTATLTIDGGCANGSIITYVITESEESIDSIFMKDNNLVIGVTDEINRLKREEKIENGAISVPYIINMQSSDIQNVYEFNLDERKIENVKGLETFYNLKKLRLGSNNLYSDNSKSDINMISNLKELQELRLSNNHLTDGNIIESLLNLVDLNLSGNEISNLEFMTKWLENIMQIEEDITEENFEEFCLLKILNISNNQIRDLTPIGEIKTITELNASWNQISKIETIKKLTNLQNIDLSHNRIQDISIMNKFSKLTKLNLAENKVKDASAISSLILTELDISNNRLTDLTDIARIGSLLKLSVNSNKIESIEPIESMEIKEKLEFMHQRIFYDLSGKDSGIVTINLPTIFEEAKNEKSKAYTKEDFVCQYCTLSADGKSIQVNVDTLGDNIATVVINGGKANGTQFSIAKPPKAEISYNIEELTNKDVIATISFDQEGVTIVNNDGKNTYTFTQNGEFEFEFENDYGYSGFATAKVVWIDKQMPRITGVEDGKTYKKEVTPMVVDENLETVTLTKDGKKVEDYEIGDTIEEDGGYKLEAIDKAGNKAVITFIIKGPDKDLEIEFNNYYEEEGEYEEFYLRNIKPNTKISDFKAQIETNGEIEIYLDQDKMENGEKIENEESLIATGYILKIHKTKIIELEENPDEELDEYEEEEKEEIIETKEFIIVVNGDTNSDGKANFSDILKINKHRLGKSELEEVYLKAGDVTGDNIADFRDILKINKFRLGKTEEL